METMKLKPARNRLLRPYRGVDKSIKSWRLYILFGETLSWRLTDRLNTILRTIVWAE